MIQLRLATLADFDAVLPRTRALNAHEGIEVPAPVFEAALRRLLGDPAIGACWLVERAGAPIGYAITTYSFDLEFGGREAYLTELWIDPAARGAGAGAGALALLEGELAARGVGALHLQVRPENPAARLYRRAGFTPSPRLLMTRRLT